MEVNFRANLVSKTTVMKQGWFSKQYKPEEVAFVKLDLKSDSDIHVLQKLKRRWSNSFLGQIYHDAAKKGFPIAVYALTTQSKEFENLKPQKILGVAETVGGDSYIKLQYLQTHPKYIYENEVKNRKYVGIGTSVLDRLKNMPDMK